MYVTIWVTINFSRLTVRRKRRTVKQGVCIIVTECVHITIKQIMLPNIILRWAGNVACMGEMRGAQRVLVNKSEVKTFLWRTRGRQDDNIQKNLNERGWNGTYLIYLAQESKSGAILWVKYVTFGFHDVQRICYEVEKRLISQEGPSTRNTYLYIINDVFRRTEHRLISE
jgi:hypothetical protein